MAISQSDAEKALEKLGQRYRAGVAAQNPMPANSRQTVEDTIRVEWEREQETAKAKQPEPPSPEKKQERKLDQPDLEP